MIKDPTRITSASSTLIDHIVTNTEGKISDCDVIHTGLSDHSLVYGIRTIAVAKKQNAADLKSLRQWLVANKLV